MTSCKVTERIVALRKEGKTWPQISTLTGLTEGSARAKYRWYRQNETEGTLADRDAQAGQGFHTAPDANAVSDELVGDRVMTLEDLLAATKVDLDVWDVERFVVNKWEVGARIASESLQGFGDNRKWVTEEQIVVTPLWQIKAWFKAKPDAIKRVQKLSAALLADIRQERLLTGPVLYSPVMYPRERAAYLFEYSPFDLHLGKLAWGDETTGASYDVPIGVDLFNASLDFLHAKAMRLGGGTIDRILCVFGNDAMHVDSKRGETTAGTHMDFDSRYIKVYRRLVHIHRRAIDILRQTAPVDVVIIPGNHDELTSFHMGEVIAAAFENVPDVQINNGPTLRKYYEYGVNLFGFTHGDAERIAELPLAMAREVPEMWARCPSREWHIGHLHKSDEWQDRKKPMLVQDLTSDKGIRIRRLTSLSGHDAWHTKHAYMDRRACEGFLFHKTAGFTDHMSFNVDHFTGKALSI